MHTNLDANQAKFIADSKSHLELNDVLSDIAEKPKYLADVKWLVLGSTDEYDRLKERVAHVCRDVTRASCIDELCINDILYTFRQFGYEVIKREILYDVQKSSLTNATNSNWLPIETAPRDGSEIMVCNSKYYIPETASFRTYHPNAQGTPTWRANNTGIKLNPTHWMPLPPRPNSNS